MLGKIYGTGAYVPPEVLDNERISQLVDTSDAWITERTGICSRHIAQNDTTVTMAVKAAQKAIEEAEILPEELDLILVSTMSSKVVMPCTACQVQKELGAENATGFDINGACTGFIFAYNTAQSYIASGIYKNVLIIGAETLSDMVNWKDRGTCILFGDGAGAVVLKAEEGGCFQTVTHSCGMDGEALECNTGEFMTMDGHKVFKFAVRQVPACIMELLEMNQLTMEDISYFVLHQANARIVESVAKKLGVGIEKFPMNLQNYGNTSSASIPILLDELNKTGKLQPGMKIVFAGFGAGLSWGATLAEI